jgi:hypothetical protein
MSVCVVDVDEGNNEGVYDDVLDMEKIITRYIRWSRICGKLRRMVGPVQELGMSVLGRLSQDTVTRETADASDHMADEYCLLLLVKEQVFATRGRGQCEGECKESLSD